ncbi:MAG: heme lyase CcmF/NrfE family subunit [Rhodocyclaceae bacterium]|nr:heme lyase CcmF/NrfE family subunit [Rhodocyclaceae bacterium]
MTLELGHFALIVALLVCCVQAVLALVGAQRAHAGMMATARPASWAQFGCLVLAWCCLTWAFVQSDFSSLLVAQHSSSQTPLIYRITGVWGNHEGSLLLWSLSLSGWTVAVALFSRRLPQAFTARVLGVLGAINAGFLAFLLFTSNPFLRLLPPALEGHDLNPLLQDPGMIIHPPLLYMGYVGFSVAFAFALAALLAGRFDAAWARWSRPWTLVAWLFLTAGIAVGSGWAYYELGWGGWWFWDPVENASFMPWLLGTALLHSLAVTEKRGAFRSWTVLLAIGAFSLSLLGTFLVRSGVVTSVHAFASDPSRGLFILGLLVAVIGVSLTVFALRAGSLGGGGRFALLSRDTSLLINNVLLAVATSAVLLGTLYPLFIDALGMGKLSVGPPYFEAVFVPLIAPVMVLMVIGPFVRWKSDTARRLLRTLWLVVLGALVLAGVLAACMGMDNVSPAAFGGLLLAAWIASASAQLLWQRLRAPGRIAAGWWGMWLAHFGLAVFILGVTVVKSGGQDLDMRMRVGQQAELAGYTFVLLDEKPYRGPNYTAFTARIAVYLDDQRQHLLAELVPEKRIYHARQMPMTEAAIDIGILRDVYVSLGERLEDGEWVVSLHYRPLISWLWAGCALMGLGALVAVLDRRYRRQRSPSPQTGAAA